MSLIFDNFELFLFLLVQVEIITLVLWVDGYVTRFKKSEETINTIVDTSNQNGKRANDQFNLIDKRYLKQKNGLEHLEREFKTTTEKIQEALDKERFQRLSKELPLEQFKEEAEKYFDDKMEEIRTTIDYSWGVDLALACHEQKSKEAQWERIKNALTNEEAFKAMFSSC